MLFKIGNEEVEVDEIHIASCGARVGVIYPDDRSPETQAKIRADLMKICADIYRDLQRQQKEGV